MSHKVIVVKIDKTEEIVGADNIKVAYVLGQQVIVSKDWVEGMVGVYFEPDLQLSGDYCSKNNLFRKAAFNTDTNKKGFFEDNRRVRCQPFMKVRSEGFFSTLESLAWTGYDMTALKLGDQFDILNGHKICEKYYSAATLKAKNNATKKKKLVDTPMFYKHVNTDQFAYYADGIPSGALLSFHHKVHGTSARYSYSKVIRTPSNWKEKLKNYLNIFKAESWEYLVGTRNVVLYEGQYKEGFHGNEQYRFDVLEQLKPFLEKGMSVYGEIAGFVNGKPVMSAHNTKALKDKAFSNKYGKEMLYKYGCEEEELRFHIYRITYTNEEGNELDFSDQQVHAWCESRNLLSPVEVYSPFIYTRSTDTEEALKKLVVSLTERPEVLTEDYVDPTHINEGIVIRVDYKTQVPKFYKSKSYAFKVMEGTAKEVGIDYEDAN